MSKRTKWLDIRNKADEEKVPVYEDINRRYLAGEKVELQEHRSGFPAVTADCGDIHILTDILSVEAWWKLKHPSCPWPSPDHGESQAEEKGDRHGD